MLVNWLSWLSYFMGALLLFAWKWGEYCLKQKPDRRQNDEAVTEERRLNPHQKKTLANITIDFLLLTPAETFIGTVAWVWLGGAILIDKIQVPLIYSMQIPTHVAVFFFMGFINEIIGPWVVGKIVELIKSKFGG